MDTYYVTRIEEPDFGCEGRPEGQEIKDKVFLKVIKRHTAPLQVLPQKRQDE